jgi:ornithine carbamoyltransferase
MMHFLDIDGVAADRLRSIINEAKSLKAELKSGVQTPHLKGKQLAMLFEKHSTRTRVSFEAGVSQLGGNAVILDGAVSQMSRGEPPQDTARVLSRYADMIMARLMRHDDLLTMAKHATVPVINGLTDYSHPCQVLADVMTFEEHRGPIKGKTVAWFGDANNVLRSFVQASERFGFRLNVAVPEGVFVAKGFAKYVAGFPNVRYVSDPAAAAAGADLLATDAWTSMGDAACDESAFMPYQVNARLIERAAQGALVMHCLPAKRGREITEEALESPSSVVFDEAENRLHVQKSVMIWCLKGGHSFV